MKMKSKEDLESTGYRCLLECVKKEGIEPIIRLFQDIKSNHLKQGATPEDYLMDKHKDIIKALKEYRRELMGLNLMDSNALQLLTNISENPHLLNLYLENAKKLEELKVSDIFFVLGLHQEEYQCDIYRDEYGNIVNITKYYTDGNLYAGEESIDQSYHSCLSFFIDDPKTTFLLRVCNNRNIYQYRGIYIMDFAFNGAKLPTEEEIQTYEIPKELMKK